MSDEDVDLPDLEMEPEADLADESWDEFDDANPKDVAASPAAPVFPKNKSFLQKNFNAIVITIVAVAGGMYFFGKFLFPSATTTPSSMPSAQETIAAPENPNAIVEAPNQTPPPMPTPMDSSSSEATNEAATNVVPIAIDSGLTPMPVKQDTAPQDKGADLTPMPTPASSADLQAPPAKPAPVTPVQSASPVAMPPSADMGPVNDKIAALEKNMASLKGDLQSKIDDSNQKIESLQSSLNSISKKLDGLASAPAQAQTAEPSNSAIDSSPSVEMPAPVKTKAPVVKAVKKKPAPVIKRAPQKNLSEATPPKAALPLNTQWELRAAQPGHASIAPKGSNDLKSIQVGDTVSGLGRITSIGLENGVWTVRGTKSAIYR